MSQNIELVLLNKSPRFSTSSLFFLFLNAVIARETSVAHSILQILFGGRNSE